MARPGSQQIAGYCPTPSSLLPSIASTLAFPAGPVSAHLLDPCAGDGTAIRTLRDLWAESLPPPDDEPPSAWLRPPHLAITAAELEEDRATALDASLDPTRYTHGDRAFHADAFRLYPEMPASTGATILFLNPPYDHDPEHRRLEHRFLLRFTSHLHPGAGVLLYLVPHYALEPSVDFLARHYLDLRAWRFPDPEFSHFRQVLLLGRRASRPLATAAFAATILRWAEDPASLPVLPARCPDPLAIDPEPDPDGYELHYRLEDLDLTAALAAFRPWEGTATGVAHPVRDLLGARFETAVPPRPAHIALALSSGMFNGHRLEANDPDRHPHLLAKGVFERTYVEVSRRVNSDGDTTATVVITEIEQPRLRLTILRLDSRHLGGPQRGGERALRGRHPGRRDPWVRGVQCSALREPALRAAHGDDGQRQEPVADASAASGAGARRLREALRQLPARSIGRRRGAGAGADLKPLSRRASGVLIAVPESALARGGAMLTEAVPKVAAFGAFLAQRFPGAAIECVAPAPGRPVTRAAVCDAFAATRAAAGDLFVVLFFGHGVPASDRRLYRRWALTTEELDGADLSRHLGALPAGVDTVVISVCCYGRDVRGAIGPSGGDVDAAGPVEEPPVVWISASGDGRSGGGIVLRAVAAQLLDEVRDAAERGASYRALGQGFSARRFAGREFHVDAWPPERLDRIVLGL